MELKHFAFLLLVVSGVVFAEEDDCEEREVKDCVSSYREYSVEDPSEKQACSQVESFITCLKDGLKKCNAEDNLDEDFAELESLYKENCADDNELNDDAKECFKSQENYVTACLTDQMASMSEVAAERDDVDENVVLCLTYTATMECVKDRLSEKCGEEVGEEFEEAIGEPPAEIQEACFADSTIEFITNILLENRKKRR